VTDIKDKFITHWTNVIQTQIHHSLRHTSISFITSHTYPTSIYNCNIYMFTYVSFTLSFSLVSPMYSASSWNRILMKIRLELVVSSSFRWMTDKTSQEMASVNRRCAKNLAAFLNLFVSKRWIVSYVSLNICWNAGINTLLTWHNLWKETHSQD